MDNSDQNRMIKYCLIALGIIGLLIVIVFVQMLIGPSKSTEEIASESTQVSTENNSEQKAPPQRIIERVEKDEVKTEDINTNTVTIQNPLEMLNEKKDGKVIVYENSIVYESVDNSSKVIIEFNPENQNMTKMCMEIYWPTEEYAIKYVDEFIGTEYENQVIRDGTVVKIDFMKPGEELEFKKEDVINSVQDSYFIEYR